MHIMAIMQPLDQAASERVTVRAASVQSREVLGLDNKRWAPAITRRPSLSLDLFQGDFSDSILPGSADFDLSIEILRKVTPNAHKLLWAGAKVTLYAGEIGDAWPWEQVFTGRVSSFKNVRGKLSLTATVDTEPFAVQFPTATYAGTGGVEGGADVKGKTKPACFGAPRNVEPILIDGVNSVFQFHAGGPLKAIETLYERGSAFAPSLADYPNYAALVAAPITAGRYATCLAAGLVRLGAPPFGVITGDIQGDNTGSSWVRKPGAILKRICSLAGISSSLLDSGSIDGMDAALGSLPGGGNMSLVLTQQQDVIEIARELARQCNYQAGVGFDGALFVTTPGFSSPALTLHAQGKAKPLVKSAFEADTSPPYKRIQMTAERSWRVHSFDEIAFEAPLVDRGGYVTGETYREGHIVTMDDGSRWLFVGATPLAGSTPSDANTNWQRMTEATASSIALGTNILANSRFGDGINQWALHWNGEASNSTFYASGGKAVLHCPAPPAGAGKVIGEINPHDGSSTYAGSGKHLFRFAPGQRIAFRLKAAANRGNFRMVPYWRLLALSPVGDEAGSRWATDGAGQFAGFPAQIDATHGESAGYIDHPGGSTVYWLDFAIYALSDSDTSPLDISIESVLLAYIDPAQTTPPAWNEGPTGEYRATYGANSSNLQVGIGANQAITTRFIDSYAPWRMVWDQVGGTPYELGNATAAYPGTDWILAGDGTLVLHDQRAGNGATDALAIATATAADVIGYPCQPGDRIEFGALIGVHRCYAEMQCQFFDASGDYISNGADGGGGPYSVDWATEPAMAGGKTIAGYKHLWHFATAPAGATQYKIIFYKHRTLNGYADSWMMLSRPYWGKALPNQTEPSPWSPGPEYLGNILSDIASIAADGVLSKGEKPQMDRDWNAIYSNWYQLDAKASAIGGLGSVQTAASSAIGALSTYLGSLSPAWNDVTTDTNISPSAMKTAWINAYGAVAALQAAIQGRPGADGVPAISASSVPPTVTVSCTFDGTPKGAVPGFAFKVFQGATDVTASASYSVIGVSGLSGLSHSGGGVFTVAGMSAATAYADVAISYGGSSQTVRVPYTKSLDGSPAVADSAGIFTPTSSYTNCAQISLYAGPGGTVEINANAGYDAASGNVGARGYVEYSLDGSTWTSMTGVVTGSVANSTDSGVWSMLGVTASGSSVGLSTKRAIYFRLMMQKVNTGSYGTFAGTFGVSWKP